MLQIDFVYEGKPQGPHKPVARNILLENITEKQTPRVMNIRGTAGSTITNIRVVNSTFDNVLMARRCTR